MNGQQGFVGFLPNNETLVNLILKKRRKYMTRIKRGNNILDVTR